MILSVSLIHTKGLDFKQKLLMVLQCKVPPPYNIYSALRSSITPPVQFIPDPDTIPEIDSLLIQSKLDSRKLRSLGKALFHPDKEKIKKAPRTMRELHKLD